MRDFDTIKDVLLRHLPRPARDMPFEVDEDGLRIEAPGVPVADIAALLADLSGVPDMLPEGVIPEGLMIEELTLEPSLAEFGADLSFVVAWKDMSLSLGEGFPLTMARIGFEKHGTRLLGFADAELTIDDLVLDVVLELPSQVIRGTLRQEHAEDGHRMLAGRGLVASGAVLRDLSVEASLIFETFDLHVEVDDLITAPALRVTEVIAQISLGGGESAAEVAARLEITPDGAPQIDLALEGEVDTHGWRLAGALEIEDGGLRAGDFVAALAGGGDAPALPGVIADAALSHVAVEVDTHSDLMRFDCTLDWAHDAELRLHLERSGERVAASGTLVMGGLIFALNLEAGEASLLVASFDAAGHAKISLDRILAAVSADAAAAFGPGGTGVELDLRALALALDGDGRVLMGGAVNAGIDLSALGDLPLLGSFMPKGARFGLEIAPAYMAQGFAAADRAQALMPADIAWPDPLTEGAHFGAHLDLAGLALDLPGVDAGRDPGAAAPPDTAPAAPSAEPMPGGAAAISWSDVDKAIGPLHVARVGYAIDGSVLDLAVDADLALGPLDVAVMGLGARYDFASRALTPRLEGLGLDLAMGGVAIGGRFLNLDGDFAGQVRIVTEPFSLSAIGAFRMLEGTPSMFVFGALDMPLGGPVFFFVDGLAAGFGLHRHLTLPAIDDLRRFPLISSAGAAADGADEDMSPDTQIARLHDYIQPRLGSHFLAAGIKFNSFRLLDGYAVVIVSFGDATEIDLLGTADFTTPPDLPKGSPALASIGLNLMARFLPEEGRLMVEAKLTPHSYVYGPLCHLSGGFAFYAWTAGTRAGDFVLSLGGYHPDYDIPDGYPVVQRLELKYQVSAEVYLKGSAYFAMTPSVMMAGGALHAEANIGALRAWADLSVDFIVAWEPFHYDAHMHVEIGASWKCFHTTASADLHIWGPSFSGRAEVDWWVFSFDVLFGDKKESRPRAIPIAKFNRSFLQIDDTGASANATLGIQPKAGVVGQAGGRPVVAPSELRLGLSTRVPVTAASLNGQDVPVRAAVLGVAPAGRAELGQSLVTVKVTDDADGSDVTASFGAVALDGNVPAALWGQSTKVDKNAAPIPATTGLMLAAAMPSVPGARQEIAAGKLWTRENIGASAWRFFASVHGGALPRTLPVDDLAALGLDTADLVAVPRGDTVLN